MVARTGVPLLAFALSAWQGQSVGVAAGGIAGFVGAVTLSRALPSRRRAPAGRIGGGVLMAAGLIVALSGLRLIDSA